MCLLTYLPAGVLPDAQALTRGAQCNNDGHGFAILVPGQDEIIIRKSMNATELIAEFVKLRQQHPDGPALFHSRLTTHGETTVDNCHPFVVNGDPRTVVAHNGILPRDAHPQMLSKSYSEGPDGVVRTSYVWDERSDTRILADDLLMDRWPNLDARATRKRLTRWLGTGNKILVLTTDPTYKRNAYLFNEHIGQWQGGVWYSNSSFRGYLAYSSRPSSSSYSTAYASSSRGWDDDWYHEASSGWTKNDRGVWCRTGATASGTGTRDTSGDPDDAASWPVTLGGTRPNPHYASRRYATCDLCVTYAMLPEFGLCLHCQQCNDCFEDISSCECYGTPRPHTIAFEDLRRALDNGWSDDMTIRRLRAYRDTVVTLNGRTTTYGTAPLAITAAPDTVSRDRDELAEIDEILSESLPIE